MTSAFVFCRVLQHTVRCLERSQPDLGGDIGLDGIYRLAPGRNGFRYGIRGQWLEEMAFALSYDQIANLDAFDLRMTFAADGHSVNIDAQERTEQAHIRIEARVCTG